MTQHYYQKQVISFKMANHIQSSLEKIIRKHDFILIDSNIDKCSIDGESIMSQLFDSTDFSSVKISQLKSNINHIIFLDRLIKKYPEKVYTVPGVKKEVYELREKLGKKLGYLNRESFSHKYSNKGRGTKTKTKQRLLDTLGRSLFLFTKTLENQTLRQRNKLRGLYPALLSCIKALKPYADPDDNKSAFINRHPRKKPKTAISRETDENLIATAFYSAIAHEKDPVIISNDKGLQHLAKVSYKVLCCNAHPRGAFQQLIRDQARKPALQIYGSSNMMCYKEVFNTRSVNIPDEFRFEKLDPAENSRLMQDIIRKMEKLDNELFNINYV